MRLPCIGCHRWFLITKDYRWCCACGRLEHREARPGMASDYWFQVTDVKLDAEMER